MNVGKRIRIGIGLIWEALIGFCSPLWIGIMYMDLTGHGKGYAYDMREEASIAVMFGVILLILWLISVVPAMVWLCRCFRSKKKRYVWIPIILFCTAAMVGFWQLGLREFLMFFGK